MVFALLAIHASPMSVRQIDSGESSNGAGRTSMIQEGPRPQPGCNPKSDRELSKCQNLLVCTSG